MARVTLGSECPRRVCAGLYVDAFDDQCCGVETPKIVEARTGAAGGGRGRLPDAASPVRVAEGSTSVVREHECVDVVLAQALPLEVVTNMAVTASGMNMVRRPASDLGGLSTFRPPIPPTRWLRSPTAGPRRGRSARPAMPPLRTSAGRA